MYMQTILGRGVGGNFWSQFWIGVSMSEPHSSEMVVIFHIYIYIYIYYYLAYIVLYILDPVI